MNSVFKYKIVKFLASILYVVGIKHNNRKGNCAGSEDVTRDHRCAHLGPSATPLARTSRLVCHCRYSHVDGRRLLVGLEVTPPRDLGDAAACPHKGPAVARLLDRGAATTDLGTASTTPDRGTSATTRRGHGVAATDWGSTAAHALVQPPSSHAASLMNRGGA
jgi:hypothetical protein